MSLFIVLKGLDLMPAISRIRLTNVIFEDGNKRYNDEIFNFDGYNGSLVLENGGGKTVFIQSVIQAIIPHTDLANRKIKNTLSLEGSPAHIAIEWILSNNPRRYLVTAVTLYIGKTGLESLRYVYEYESGDAHGIAQIPFVKSGNNGKRPAGRGEIQDYYSSMRERSFAARTFSTITEYRSCLENDYNIIADEWESIVKINTAEGDVDSFFENCKTTNNLFDRLLIPVVENSIANYKSDLFADIFETQQDNFKEYKRLKATIAENLRIQARLDQYLDIYKMFHQSELEYNKAKGKTKGLWTAIIEEKQNVNHELLSITEQQKKLEEQELEYKLKLESYEIEVVKQQYQTLEKQFLDLQASYLENKDGLTQDQQNYYSLKFAKLELDIKSEQNNEKLYLEEMKLLQANQEFADVEAKLTKARQALLGNYLAEIKGFEESLKLIIDNLTEVEDQLITVESDIAVLNQEEKQLEKEKSNLEGQQEFAHAQMKRLANQLLAKPDQENIDTELKIWNTRHNELDQLIVDQKQKIISFERKQRQDEDHKERLLDRKQHSEQDCRITENQLENVKNKEAELIAKLTTVRPQWSKIETIYEIEESISSILDETIKNLTNERNRLLIQERIKTRFVDDYSNQDTFFSDPYLANQLASWKNQFDYLSTGVEYLQGLDPNEFEKAQVYPLWALTLITTQKSKTNLVKKVDGINDKLLFPIIVMSTEEVLEVHKKEYIDWLVPAHWRTISKRTDFQQWRQSLANDAQLVIDERTQKELEIDSWKQLASEFSNFVSEYPFTVVSEMRDRKSSLARNIESFEIQIDELTDLINDYISEQKNLAVKIDNNLEELHGLEGKIAKAIDYQDARSAVTRYMLKIKGLDQNIEAVQVKLRSSNEIRRELEQKNFELTTTKNQTNYELKKLQSDQEYLKLQSLTAIFTDQTKNNIRNQIEILEAKLKNITSSYQTLEAQLESARNNIQRNQNEKLDLEKQCSSIDKSLTYPPNGLILIEELWLKIEAGTSQLKLLSTELANIRSKKDKQAGILENKLDLFQSRYPDRELYQFHAALDEVEHDLMQLSKELTNRKEFLKQEYDRFTRKLDKITESEKILDRFIEKHHFNAPDVEIISLAAEDRKQLPYNQSKFVEQMIRELNKSLDVVETFRGDTFRERQALLRFCQGISDVKMRKKAEEGISANVIYEDLVQFKNNMVIRVEQATKYANEHIRQKDAELQAFINQIHNHLITLSSELRQIPKKTRVKIEDTWKEIYAFTIPDWKEEAGKTRIREHIEWILSRLEADEYIDEHGQQDNTKVRKDIEKWLQTKQLLRIVMENEVMKVTCRKVTNDNKVSSRYYLWESSNSWSGGEKWSKNMTLFLGLLNYIAEKKQYISKDMPRHRVVILDNPFGKASSDHVLTPVFFIAEQLGFQIIALTAHAEGKFLQDYFPIIYSCRLRPTNQAGKMVMSTEKQLHHAYFQEHDPQALSNLVDPKQLELFQ